MTVFALPRINVFFQISSIITGTFSIMVSESRPTSCADRNLRLASSAPICAINANSIISAIVPTILVTSLAFTQRLTEKTSFHSGTLFAYVWILWVWEIFLSIITSFTNSQSLTFRTTSNNTIMTSIRCQINIAISGRVTSFVVNASLIIGLKEISIVTELASMSGAVIIAFLAFI